MTIGSNLTTFDGMPVRIYERGAIEPSRFVYRLAIEWDDANTFEEVLETFLQQPNVGEVESLIIGAYELEGGSSDDLIEMLARNADKLPKLKSLFIGDITYEEQEISWIEQSDMAPVISAFPGLKYLRVRGGNGLGFSNLNHTSLETLIVESGGLPPSVIEDISNSNLPELKHLELWLGSDNYGYDSTPEDFQKILSGKMFPKLTYLGLRDAEAADDIAEAVKSSELLNRIEVLDMSMGALGDRGALALLEHPGLKKLKFLNLRHHYMSQEVMDKIIALGIAADISGKEVEEEEGYRYIEVSE